MKRYFFNQNGDLCYTNTRNDVVLILNIDTELISKIKKDFYIDTEGNLFHFFTESGEFGSTKILSDHKFVDILNFNDNIFLVSDSYHLFIVEEHWWHGLTIINFSDKACSEQIKYIHCSWVDDDLAWIYYENSISIFKYYQTGFGPKFYFTVKINNVTEVIYNDQWFTLCIKNKYYDISRDSVEHEYDVLFAIIFFGSQIILFFLLFWASADVLHQGLRFIITLLSMLVLDTLILKLWFEVIDLSINLMNVWILLWFTAYAHPNKINYGPKNIPDDTCNDDIIQIILNDGTIVCGNLVQIKSKKSARFLGNN